jgi:hypothetical protein
MITPMLLMFHIFMLMLIAFIFDTTPISISDLSNNYVLNSSTLKTTVTWDVMPYSLIDRLPAFRGNILVFVFKVTKF